MLLLCFLFYEKQERTLSFALELLLMCPSELIRCVRMQVCCPDGGKMDCLIAAHRLLWLHHRKQCIDYFVSKSWIDNKSIIDFCIKDWNHHGLCSVWLLLSFLTTVMGAELYETPKLSQTGAHARFVVIQECADEQPKPKMQPHCFLHSLSVFPSLWSTVSLVVVSCHSCPDSPHLLNEFV